jgi:hypothetical protein
MGPVGWYRLEPHLRIELYRGGHGRERIDPYSLVPELTRPIEKRASQAGPESRASVVLPHVDSLDFADVGFQLPEGAARHHLASRESEHDFPPGRAEDSRQLCNLLVNLPESDSHVRFRGTAGLTMVGEPPPVVSEQSANSVEVARPIHCP